MLSQLPPPLKAAAVGRWERGVIHKYTRDIFVRGTMEMFFHDMAMELDQDLKGDAKRAFRSCIHIYMCICI